MMFMSVRPRQRGVLGPMRGLGALPPVPPLHYTTQGGPLKPNHQWVRYYEVDTSHQLRSCPKNPPFGCWIIDGYAWGQREWYPPEFQPQGFVLKPLPAPFPHPAVVVAKPKPKPKPAPKPVVATKPQPKPTVMHTPTKVPTFPAPAPMQPSPTPSNTTVQQPVEDVPQEVAPKRRLLGGVGAIVGVGLFVAIGLTLLRKPR